MEAVLAMLKQAEIWVAVNFCTHENAPLMKTELVLATPGAEEAAAGHNGAWKALEPLRDKAKGRPETFVG